MSVTNAPALLPSEMPSGIPTATSSTMPSLNPSASASARPSAGPTVMLSDVPSIPSSSLSSVPSSVQSSVLSSVPSPAPSYVPTSTATRTQALTSTEFIVFLAIGGSFTLFLFTIVLCSKLKTVMEGRRKRKRLTLSYYNPIHVKAKAAEIQIGYLNLQGERNLPFPRRVTKMKTKAMSNT